jgi:TRAP-type uncharacterized transport system fused permease subunit
VPFLFLFSPSLLLQGEALTTTMIAVATAIGGVWIVSAGMIGYFLRPLAPAPRIGLVVAGAALLIPDEIGTWAAWTDLGGLLLACVVLGVEYLGSRRKQVAEVNPATSVTSAD